MDRSRHPRSAQDTVGFIIVPESIDPLISIIVPFYNARNYLTQCLASIQTQIYSKWECICVDDGSRDESSLLVNSFVDNDSRFRLVRQVNGGPGVARNTGLTAAVGQYFTFVDADDALHPQMLECLVRCAEKHGSDLTLCAHAEFTIEVPVRNVDLDAVISSSHCLKAPLFACLLDYRRHQVQPWGKLYRADRHGCLRFPCMYGAEDLYILIDIYARSLTLAMVEEELYYYRTDGGTLTRNGLRTYKTYIMNSSEVASHCEEVCLGTQCDPATRVKLVRKFGSCVVLLYLFEALSDRRLSREEKKVCVELARNELTKVCDASVDGWRSMPIKYWYLYPAFVRYEIPGVIYASVVIRNAIRRVYIACFR